MAKLVNAQLDFTNSGLRIQDTDASHVLTIKPGSNITADRILTLTTGDTSRTLDISAADVTISSAGASFIAGIGTNGLRTNLGLGTGDSPQFAGLNVGDASDTTITRLSAGSLAVEGNEIYRVGGTDVAIVDGGTGASTATQAATNLGLGTANAVTFANITVDTAALTGASTAKLNMTCTDPGALGPYFYTYHNSASPAASDQIGSWYIYGKNQAGTQIEYSGIRCYISSPSTGTEGSYQSYLTYTNGSYLERLRIAAGLFHPSATGGDKGNNTINFGAVYDDNVLLTCFVLEYKNTGTIDLNFWNKLSPNGYHTGANRFWNEKNLLNLEEYIKFWKEKSHLPGMPSKQDWKDHAKDKISVGDMISRLWQTVEMQAVHISELSERLKLIEGKFNGAT